MSTTGKELRPDIAAKLFSADLRLLTFKGSTNKLRETLIHALELEECRHALAEAGHSVQPDWSHCVVLLEPAQMPAAERIFTLSGLAQPRRYQVVTNNKLEDIVLEVLQRVPCRQGRPRVVSSVCLTALLEAGNPSASPTPAYVRMQADRLCAPSLSRGIEDDFLHLGFSVVGSGSDRNVGSNLSEALGLTDQLNLSALSRFQLLGGTRTMRFNISTIQQLVDVGANFWVDGARPDDWPFDIGLHPFESVHATVGVHNGRPFQHDTVGRLSYEVRGRRFVVLEGSAELRADYIASVVSARREADIPLDYSDAGQIADVGAGIS